MSAILLLALPKRGVPVPPPPHDAALLGELAATMFLRPQRLGRRMPREQAYLESAQPLALRTSLGELAGWQWGDPAAPLVGLVHGWEGHGAQLGAFVAPLVAAGFRVLGFDAPGHGDSPGDEAHVPLVAWMLAEIEPQTGPFCALIGHSMGAAAAAQSTVLGVKPRAMVMLSPPLSQLDRVERVAARLQLSPEVRAAFFAAVERKTATPYELADVRAPARSAACPLLVFHDPADTDTDYADSEKIVAAWRAGAQLVPCPGRGHYRILATPEIVRQTVEFITGLR
ncbi:MAG: alpha/beta fold hydrolase [Opitutae bacterium]|nr:alpha/beta fold hydrolase [Opitutae bacterium]